MPRDARKQPEEPSWRRAERLVERRLRRRGYLTLARNLRVGHDEIDLLMRAPCSDLVVLVEVKSSARGLLAARRRLDRRKRRCVARALRNLDRAGVTGRCRIRVDAVIVDLSGPKPRFEHLRGRTLPPAPSGAMDRGRSG